MRSDYDRGANESFLWTPVLRSQGFSQTELAKDNEDWAEAFDMVARIRFALRSRKVYPGRPDYLRQFTIRWKRSSGALTEKDKLLDGADFPEYMCYGFSSDGVLTTWAILRVHVLRRMYKAGQLDLAKAGEFRNTDIKQSTFRVFWLDKLVKGDPGLVWKSSPNHPGIPVTQAPTPSCHLPLTRQLRLN